MASPEPRNILQPDSEPLPEDRRSQSRQPTDLRMACKSVDLTTGLSWPGDCCEVSEQGIRVLMLRRFEPRTLLLIELKDAPPLVIRSLLARVVWTEKAHCGRWIAGCSLVHSLHTDELDSLRMHQESGISKKLTPDP
jgi:hypothetical protein